MSKVTALDFGLSKVHIIQDKGTILVDTGCYTAKSEYAKKLSELGIDPSEVKLIILTHGHWDHVSRAAELKELTGAPVLCHRNAVDSLKNGDKRNYPPRGEDGKKFVGMIINDVPDPLVPLDPDIIIDDGFDLKPYGVDGKIIYTPGHSDDSISIVLDSGEAIIGDMVLTSPFTGTPCLALVASDESKLKNSLSKLLNLAQVFYGGHSGPYTKQDLLSLLA
jgi:glyoxylase-like metal-dependent hydrolase (beta-lactamase superfamily II)